MNLMRVETEEGVFKEPPCFVDKDTGLLIEPQFLNWKYEDYIKAGIRFVVPMTAHEIEKEEDLDIMCKSGSGYIAEEKIDGTRGTLHFFYRALTGYGARCFSRRVSKKTGWFCENTDSLPHLRELDFPQELARTVIDGEMKIQDKPFEDVSGTLNCNWDKAIDRQIELGMITFNAFDIIYYKGVYIAKMPLWKRKKYLRKVIEAISSPYVKELFYTDTSIKLPITARLLYKYEKGELESYLNLERVIQDTVIYNSNTLIELDKRSYYEYIVASGGEGLIFKDKKGKYYHKRGREYSKWKKFLTRDCIIMGFTEPTKEYKGKFPNDKWEYWEHNGSLVRDKRVLDYSAKELIKQGYIFVSKYFYEKWVGNIRFGVIVTESEMIDWQNNNPKVKPILEEIDGNLVLEVGDCSGFDEEQRKYFTDNKEELIGKVVEIKANEIFTKTGKLRHPRYNRMRPDKSANECVWIDHINILR